MNSKSWEHIQFKKKKKVGTVPLSWCIWSWRNAGSISLSHPLILLITNTLRKSWWRCCLLQSPGTVTSSSIPPEQPREEIKITLCDRERNTPGQRKKQVPGKREGKRMTMLQDGVWVDDRREKKSNINVMLKEAGSPQLQQSQESQTPWRH